MSGSSMSSLKIVTSIVLINDSGSTGFGTTGVVKLLKIGSRSATDLKVLLT